LKALFLTCARNGSKGIKNKNLAEVAGKPLIHHTLDFLKTSQLDHDLVLSSDGDPIASACQDKVDLLVQRPEALASDTAARAPVLKHAFEQAEAHFGTRYELVFDFLVTAPLRSHVDIQACLELLQKQDVENVITAVPSHRSPYFNMVELEGQAPKVVKGLGDCTRRQDAPATFDMNGSIYAWTREAFLRGAKLFTPKTRLHVMDESTGIDVDTAFDLKILKHLIP
jgi:CMP-N-acetylneuraminic acid synthetase